MTKKITLVLLLLSLGLNIGAQTAQEIIDRVRDREDNQTMQSRVQMILTSKDGVRTERLLDQFSVRTGTVTKSVMVFQRPANVANTRFLVLSEEGTEDNRWIFLPNLARVRRIAGSEGGSSFVGTDFTYDDLSIREASRDNHRLLREDTVDGQKVFVIESSPKTPGDSQYSKVVSYILPDKWLPIKLEMYDRQGRLLKVMTAGQIENVQGIWSYRKAKMENVQAGTSTEINLQIIEYGKRIPDGVFTTRFLETGRP